MRKRSYIYKLVIATLSAMMVVACSGNKPPEKVEQEESAPIKVETVQVWCSPEAQEIITEAGRLFSEKNEDVEIKVTPVPAEALEAKLEMAYLNQKEIPDVIEVGTYRTSHLVNRYPELFTDLKAVVSDIKSDILSWKLEEVTIEDKVYALPWNISPKVMLYNMELAERHGINPFDIKTWEDFLKLGQTLEIQPGGKIKLIAVNENSSGILYSTMLRQLGTGLYVNVDKISLPVDENKRVLSLIKNMYDSKIIYEVKENEDALTIVSGQAALCTIVDSREVKRVNDNYSLYRTNWQMEAFPAFEYGGKNIACGEGNGFMVTKKERENSATEDFVKFFISDSESNTLALQELGYISAATEHYNLPAYNEIRENYSGLKVWRYMAEQSRGETALIYDYNYSDIAKRLLQLEKDVIAGGDIEMSVKLAEEELNEIIDNGQLTMDN